MLIDAGLEKIKELLSENIFENIVQLKMLDAYGVHMGCHMSEASCGNGVLLYLPVKMSAFDSEMYPEADAVILLNGSGEQVLEELIPLIPRQQNLVFKISRDEHKRILGEEFELERKKCYLSYTCPPDKSFPAYSDVVRSDRLDERLLLLWEKNGYSVGEIKQFFEKGACSFSIFRDDLPACTCLVFPNYREVWELGALHTVDRMRGKGFARQTVSTALNWMLKKGLVPRYQVAEANTASIRLAESIGLEPFVRMEHYYYCGKA